MTRYVAAYTALLAVMVALDLLWLGVIAKPLYQSGIGHLMAAQPKVGVAVLFYLVYALGVLLFAVLPNAGAPWRQTLMSAALFGFFAYATYDLTNLATLREWPLLLSVIDITWGVVVSATAALAGHWALTWVTHRG